MMFDEKCIKSDVCGMAICDGTRDCSHAVTKLVEVQSNSVQQLKAESCAYCVGKRSSYTESFGPTINYCSHCGRNLSAV